MDWTQVISYALAGTSVTALVINKVFSKREDKAKAQREEIVNGMTAMEFYKAIEDAVKVRVDEDTKPLKEQLSQYKDKCERLEKRVNVLEQEIKKQGCYQPKCDSRLAKEQADIFA